MIRKHTALGIEARMEAMGFIIPSFHLVGVRSQDSVPNKFDDNFYVIENHKLLGQSPYWCTTNPGKDWLEKLLNPKGTAILCADRQYLNCFRLGLHKGKEALIQCADLWVYRDDNNNGIEEQLKGPMIAGPECRIDIHGTYKNWVSQEVGAYSAGCQVLNNPPHYQEMINFCKGSAKSLFTYTLLSEF